MSSSPAPQSLGTVTLPTPAREDFPLTVRDAASYLGAEMGNLLSLNPKIHRLRADVILKGLFRQETIEQHSPVYLRNVIRILTETGLRVYKELAPMRKDQVDLANKTIFISDSKTGLLRFR